MFARRLSVQLQPNKFAAFTKANGHMRQAYESLGLTFIDIPAVAVA